MWLERCYSRSSEKDSNPAQMQRKDCARHLRQQSLVRLVTWKIAICWGFELTVVGDSRRASNLAAMQQHLAKSQVKDGIEIFAFEW